MHRYLLSIVGHAVDIASMMGIYYCCRDKELWWSVAATPFIAIPWLLVKVVLAKKIATCTTMDEENHNNNEGSAKTNDLMPPATLNWLNDLIETLWRTYGSFANQVFTKKVWPEIKEQLCKSSKLGCVLVELQEFDIGTLPPRIIGISCFSQQVSEHDMELLLKVEITFNSNASITLSGLGGVKDILARNVKFCLLLKGLSPSPPFIRGFQVFLSEEPDITWETVGLAKVTDFIGIEAITDYLIEENIRRELVLPNRISVEIPEAAITALLRKMGLEVPAKEEMEQSHKLD